MQNNGLHHLVDDVSADEVRLYQSGSQCVPPSMRNDEYYALLVMSPSCQWSAAMSLPTMCASVEVQVNACRST